MLFCLYTGIRHWITWAHSNNTLSRAHSVLRLTAGRPNTTNTLASLIQSTFKYTSPAITSCLQVTVSFLIAIEKELYCGHKAGILTIVSHTWSLQRIQALCFEFLAQILCTSRDCLKWPAAFFVLQDNNMMVEIWHIVCNMFQLEVLWQRVLKY